MVALFLRARLAQSVEQLTFNQWVAGSIPAARTNYINDLRAFWHLVDVTRWFGYAASSTLVLNRG